MGPFVLFKNTEDPLNYMNCQKCKSVLHDNAKFCQNCGAGIKIGIYKNNKGLSWLWWVATLVVILFLFIFFGDNQVTSIGMNLITNSRNKTTEFNNICASFEYSDWSSCSVDGTQNRIIAKAVPDGCIGGNPEISRQCIYKPIITLEYLGKKNNFLKLCDGYKELINTLPLKRYNNHYGDEYTLCNARIQNLPNISIEGIQGGQYKEYVEVCLEFLWHLTNTAKNVSFEQDRKNAITNNNICEEVKNANSNEEIESKIEKYNNYILEYLNKVDNSSVEFKNMLDKLTIAEQRTKDLVNSSPSNLQQEIKAAERMIEQELKSTDRTMLNACLSSANAYLGPMMSTIELEKMKIDKRTECYLRYPQY